jgi:AraC-like DNA-binding protein
VSSGVPAALAPHPVFIGGDWDLERIRAAVSDVINPHYLRLRDRHQRVRARQFASRVGDVTLTYLAYDADIEISAPDAATCFCIQFPLAGRATVQCGPDRIAASRCLASVPSPSEPLVMRWTPDAAHLIVRIERSAVERHLYTLLDRPVREPIRMRLGLDLTGASGARWAAILDLLQADIAQRNAESYGPGGDVSAATIQELVMNSLLLCHPNNYWDRFVRGTPPARAPYVRRAVEYAHAHLDSPLTVARLAEVAGVSVRALQAGFARDFNCSPTSYVRDLRLDRVHAELSAGDPADGVQVTDVALRWGFSHLGRFSHVYSERFGELPSATLRCSPRW